MNKNFPTSAKVILFLLLTSCLSSCKNNNQETELQDAITMKAPNEKLFFELSLAQWSLNEEFFSGKLDPLDFAQKANSLGFTGIEYVNQFYTPLFQNAEDPHAALQSVLDSLKAKSEQYGVQNVLIMVDGEGDLASADPTKRNSAVENHKKWVDAAQFLGCHSIRVNLSGSNIPEEWINSAREGLKQLGSYAAEKNINVIVENHGGLSSNAALLTTVLKQVDMKNCGSLPDFGNFCITRENETCVESYPIYQGVEEMMEFAKAVSAKSYDFNEAGQETTIDYSKMLKIVKDAGYTGFIGVEYEGENLSSEEGILATKELLIREGKKLTVQ